MTYSDNIIGFSFLTLFGLNVTQHHYLSLLIIQNRHNFGHNLNMLILNREPLVFTLCCQTRSRPKSTVIPNPKV